MPGQPIAYAPVGTGPGHTAPEATASTAAAPGTHASAAATAVPAVPAVPSRRAVSAAEPMPMKSEPLPAPVHEPAPSGHGEVAELRKLVEALIARESVRQAAVESMREAPRAMHEVVVSEPAAEKRASVPSAPRGADRPESAPEQTPKPASKTARESTPRGEHRGPRNTMVAVLAISNVVTLAMLSVVIVLMGLGDRLGDVDRASRENNDANAEFANLAATFNNAAHRDDGNLHGAPVAMRGNAGSNTAGANRGDEVLAEGFSPPYPPEGADANSITGRWFVRWILFRGEPAASEVVVFPYRGTGIPLQSVPLQLGDALEGAKVTDIQRGHIVFNEGGRDVTLYALPIEGTAGGGNGNAVNVEDVLRNNNNAAAPNAFRNDAPTGNDASAGNNGASAPNGGNNAASNVDNAAAGSVGTDPLPPPDYVKSWHVTPKMAQQFAADPLAVFWNDGRVNTVLPEGSQRGLLLASVPRDSFLGMHEIVLNDVLVALNKMPILTASDIDAFAAEGKFRSDFTITFMRQGKRYEFRFSVPQ